MRASSSTISRFIDRDRPAEATLPNSLVWTPWENLKKYYRDVHASGAVWRGLLVRAMNSERLEVRILLTAEDAEKAAENAENS